MAIIIIIAVYEIVLVLSPTGHMIGFHFLLPWEWVEPISYDRKLHVLLLC